MAIKLNAVRVEVHGGHLAQVLLLQAVVALAEVGTHEVADAQAFSRGLVGVGGTDAFQRGADLHLAEGLLVGGVQGTVGGEDQMGSVGDEQGLPQVEAGLLEALDLALQDVRVDDDAVADEVDAARGEHARRDVVQHELLAFKRDGVTGVGSALEACDDVIVRGEGIDDLAFAFVTPL